jgi:hypothetical protein
MKLIKQLSKDYTKDLFESILGYDRPGMGDLERAFEDGFRRAKTLLRAKEPMKTRTWFEIPMCELEQLGEEEV